MSTSTADAKKRIVLPGVEPGEVFYIQNQGEGRFVLERLQRPEPSVRKRKSREDSLRAIAEAPLHPTMSWEELRQFTREL